MFFSKKDRHKDIEDIKKAMNSNIKEDGFDEHAHSNLPHELHDIPELMHEELPSPKRPHHVEHVPEPKMHPLPEPRIEHRDHREHGMVAPLFVKVDKYKELLSAVQNMKVFVSGIKQLFDVLQELESVRAESMKTMRASVQRFERSITEMDTELLRPRGVDFTDLVESEQDVKHIETSLTDLQRQIAGLRSELKELE